MNRASSPIAFEPPPTHASGKIRQPTLDRRDLGRGLVADPALEVADDRRVRVRAHRRAEHVMRGLDVRDPVAHRLVDRVLQRRRAGRHRADLGAERPHPEDVRALALDVLGAHVDDARQVEQGAGGGGRNTVLAGSGLGDHPGLAKPAGQQRLAQRVVDLVRAGVGEVLALEVEAEVGDPGGRGAPTRPSARAASWRTASARRSARYRAVGRPAKWPSSSRSSAQKTGSWRTAS